MPRAQKIVLSRLNIAASPHPKGIYARLFEAANDIEVQFWGKDYAKITSRADADANRIAGRILIWTRIDKKDVWLNKKSNRAATETDMTSVQLPPNLAPNFRSFDFVFTIDNHTITLVSQNELGETLSPRRAAVIFEKLFSNEISQLDVNVEVTAVPDSESIKRILKIDVLRTLTIFLKRPNPDDLTDVQHRVLEKLRMNGAKSQEIVLTKAADAPSLTPDADIKAIAEVASRNGWVSGKGRLADGTRVEESTKEHPLKIEIELPERISSRQSLIRWIRDN